MSLPTDYTNIVYPKLWSKPRAKIYDMNRMYGEYYYQPMLTYIDDKDITGGSLMPNKSVQMATLLSREPVSLPNPHELSSSKIGDLRVGTPRLVPFLTKYRAKQIKEANTKTARVEFELLRNSKDMRTLSDKRPSTLIRNQYISEISQMHGAGYFS